MSNKKLDPEVKTEWLRRLRSGEYTQGVNYLKTTDVNGNDRHCCLGVLCDMAVEAGVLEEHIAEGDPFQMALPTGPKDVFYAMYHEFGTPRSIGMPPREVVEWAFGLEPGIGDDLGAFWIMRDGGLIGDHGDDYIPTANDNGATFEEVADAVEMFL